MNEFDNNDIQVLKGIVVLLLIALAVWTILNHLTVFEDGSWILGKFDGMIKVVGCLPGALCND